MSTILFAIVIGFGLLLVAMQILAPETMARFSRKFRDDRYDSGDSDPGTGDF